MTYDIKKISQMYKEKGLEATRKKLIEDGFTTQDEINNNISNQKQYTDYQGGIGDEFKSFGNDSLNAYKNLGTGVTTGFSNLLNMAAGLDEFKYQKKKDILDGIKNIFGIEGNTFLDDYYNKVLNTRKYEQQITSDFTNKENQKAAERTENTNGLVMKKVSELTPSIGQMSVGALGSMIHPAVGAGYFFGSAGGGYKIDAENKGATDDQALLYGSILGAAEGATEMIGMGALLKGGKALGKGAIKEAIKSYGINIADNFIQEAIMEPIQESTSQLVMGKSDWEKMPERMLKAGIDGALVALIMDGASSGINSSINIVNKVNSNQNVTPVEIEKAKQDISNVVEKIGELEENKQSTDILPTATSKYLNQEQIADLNTRFNNILSDENQVNIATEKLPTIKTSNGKETSVNSLYENKNITLNESKPELQKVVHELTHHMENLKGYENFSDFILTELDKNGLLEQEKQKTIDTYAPVYNAENRVLTDETINSEIVARYSERLFNDIDTIKKFTQTNRNFVQKIYDWIVDKVEYYKTIKNMTVEQKNEYETLRKARKLYMEALKSEYKPQSVVKTNDLIKTAAEETQNVVPTAKSDNLKNQLVNKINTLRVDETTKNTLLQGINEISNITQETYDNLLNEVNSMENDYIEYNKSNETVKDKYRRYSNEKYDSKIVKNAKEIVPANNQGRRTKTEWLKVANQIALNVADKTELEKYAYKSWMELRPNQKENLNRQGEKYVSFRLDEWIDAFENANDKKYSISGKKGAENLGENVIDKYNNAVQMEKVGISNENIRQATGWFKDKNGDWKFEFTDKQMELKENLKPNTSYKLGDILKHDTLFEAYPELVDYDVKVKDFGKRKTGGIFNRTDKVIFLNNNILQRNKKSIEGTLIHEIQHAIQNIEGFEGGASVSLLGSKLSYFNSLGEIEANDTKKRFFKEKYENRILNNAPESSKANPKHERIDNYLKNRNVIDKIKDGIYNYFGGDNENNEINFDTYEENEIKNKEKDGSKIFQKDERIYRQTWNGYWDKRGRHVNSNYSIESDNKSGSFFTPNKQKQFDIIQKNNPMTDEYHTGIRSIDDIKTFEEAIKDDESFVYGDFTEEDAKKALREGKVTVYSSKPIEQGGFVSTSKNMAKDYAGNAKIYSKEVSLNDVAWINGDEGQYAKVNETKYSLDNSSTTDNKGRTLTKEQQEYFKDSKVRDENGNLLEVYHGTEANAGIPKEYWFTTFDLEKASQHVSSMGDGFYFTDDYERASSYAHSKGNVYKSYLNITNPFIKDNNKTFKESVQDINPNYDINNLKMNNSDRFDGTKLRQYLIDNGYDGIELQGTYVAFYPNQIKNVDNVNPTFNSDIRYSLESDTDNKGRTLSKEQKEYFRNSKAVTSDGKLETVYHGSNKAGFTVFNRNYNYYTNNEQVAKSYTGGTEKVDTKRLENISEAKKWLESITDELYIKDNTIYDYDNEEILKYNNEEELLKNLKRNIQEEIGSTEAGGTYEGYVNIENPIVIDANGDKWSMIGIDGINIDGIGDIKQFLEENGSSVWREKGKLRTSTADIVSAVMDAVEEGKINADGVIIKNVYDEGGYGSTIPTEIGTDYITFNSKQFKAFDNLKPTTNEDIRYSLEKGQRKHYESIKNSENVNPFGRKIAEDLLENERYIPIKNKNAIRKAEQGIMNNGLNESLNEFKAKLNSNQRLSANDIALGEKLIQEYSQLKDFKTVSDLIQDVAMLGTELGQQVQAMSLINRMTPEGQLKYIEKTLTKLNNKNNTDISISSELKENILKAETKEELNEAVCKATEEIAAQLPVSISDKLRSWRYLSMLGNPRTHIRNILSNVAMKGTQAVKNKIAGGIEDIINPTERTKTLKKVDKITKEFALKDADTIQSRLADGGHEDILSKVKLQKRSFDNKILNKASEINSNLLEKEDWIFLKSAYKNSLANYMTANKLTADYLSKGTKEANIALEKARTYAINEAQEATFRQYSELANTISMIENKNAFSKVFVGGVLPFKKTPINIAKAGFEYSPIGLFKATKEFVFDVKSGNKTVNQAIDTLSKGLTGTSIVGIGMLLASMGILKASGSGNDKEENYLQSIGEQKYSIRIGDKTYTLDWLSPAAMPLFVGVELYNINKKGDAKLGNLTNLASASAQVINPLMEMSMLQGLTSAISSYNPDGIAGKLSNIGYNALESYIGQYVPTLSAQIARIVDDTERNTSYTDKSGFERTLDRTKNRILAKIPFASTTLQPKTDIWGNEVKRNPNVLARATEQTILPYYSKQIQNSKVDQEVQRLYTKTADNGVLPIVPSSEFAINSTKYKLDSKDYSQYKEKYGKESKSTIEEVIKTKEYKQLTDEEKSSVLQKIYSDSKEEAKENYASKNDITILPTSTQQKLDDSNLSTTNKIIYESIINKISGNKNGDGTTTEGSTLGNKAKYIMNMNTTNEQKNALLSVLNDSSYKITTDMLKKVDKASYSNFFALSSTANSKGITQKDKYVMLREFGIDSNELDKYMKQVNKISGTKDSQGKTITGSKKENVFNYINSLNLPADQKLILYVNAGYTDGTEDVIYNYINSLDLTGERKQEIYNMLYN